MTKSKSSTIAIVVLSVLLAAALASTIVLAAFSQTRTATTTITFASGVTVTATGLNASNNLDAVKVNGTTITNTAIASGTVSVTDPIAIKSVTINNTSAQAIALAVNFDITGTNAPSFYVSSSDSVAATDTALVTTGNVDAVNYLGSGSWNVLDASNYAGWYYITLTAENNEATTDSIQVLKTINTNTEIESKDFTATLKVVAVVSNTDSVANLKAAIDANQFTAFGA